MDTQQTNSNHYVARFLMRAWEMKPNSGRVWAFDFRDEAGDGRIYEAHVDDLNCLPGLKAVNDTWNALIESPSVGAIRRFRASTQGPKPRLEELKGLASRTSDALSHLFLSARSRCPDVPPIWGGLSQDEYLAALADEASNRALLEEWNGRHRPLLFTATASSKGFALTDWVVFSLPPVERRGILAIPVSPAHLLIYANRRIPTSRVMAELTSDPMDLPAFSCGAPATTLCLPPKDLPDGFDRAREAASVSAKVFRWKPAVLACGWGVDVDLD